MTLMIKSMRFMTLSMVSYEAFLLPIMTGRFSTGQSGISCLYLSMTNAMHSFIRLSRLGGTRAISTIMPICHQKKKKTLSIYFNPSQQKSTFFTHRHPVIHEAVAMVTAISPGRMQPHHHLVPVSILAQQLWEACQIAFGQPLEFSHHLLSLVHGVKTVHPKHNLHLNF